MDRLTERFHGGQSDRPVFVPTFRAHSLWPFAEDLIKAAFEHTGCAGIDATRDDVLSGKSLLWITWNGLLIEAALVTKITKPYDTKVCILVACAGKGNWPVLIETIEDYARLEGCTRIQFTGRTGWKRAMQNYHQIGVVMEREI